MEISDQVLGHIIKAIRIKKQMKSNSGLEREISLEIKVILDLEPMRS